MLYAATTAVFVCGTWPGGPGRTRASFQRFQALLRAVDPDGRPGQLPLQQQLGLLHPFEASREGAVLRVLQRAQVGGRPQVER